MKISFNRGDASVRTRSRWQVFLLAMLMLLCVSTSACGNKSDVYENIEDLQQDETLSIATWPGCPFEAPAQETFPHANFRYYYLLTDMIESLYQDKVDAICAGGVYRYSLAWSGVDVREFPLTDTDPIEYSALFSGKYKNSSLLNDFNTYIKTVKSNGQFEKWEAKWLQEDNHNPQLDTYHLTGENGKLVIALSGVERPMAYLDGDQLKGLEADLLYSFCEEYGYSIEIASADFTALISGLSTGRYDVMIGAVGITPERAANTATIFSDSFYTDHASCYVDTPTSGTSFGGAIEKRLAATFIEGGRWKSIVSGIFVTLFITIVAILAGSLLGFILYVGCRHRSKVVIFLTKTLQYLMLLLPIVVILMIFYYLVFSSTQISPVVVAAIVFSLSQAAAVSQILENSEISIPEGQHEAALAMGYSETKTFFHILLPQMIRVAFPSYTTEVISLLKSTAIVGYVAAQDLTRVGDIIRALTFDAFFPLMTVALIYALIVALFIKLLEYINMRLDFTTRSKEQILRGIRVREDQ